MFELTKGKVTAIICGIFAIIVLCLMGSVAEDVKNEQIVVNQYPFTGKMGNEFMSHDEDSATIHKMTTTGVCVLDPTRTVSLIPSILTGN